MAKRQAPIDAPPRAALSREPLAERHPSWTDPIRIPFARAAGQIRPTSPARGPRRKGSRGRLAQRSRLRAVPDEAPWQLLDFEAFLVGLAATPPADAGDLHQAIGRFARRRRLDDAAVGMLLAMLSRRGLLSWDAGHEGGS